MRMMGMRRHMGTCACRNSDPDIMMVQSAEDGQRENGPAGLDRSRRRESLAKARCVRVPL